MRTVRPERSASLSERAVEGRSYGWLWLTVLAIGGAVLAFALVRQKGQLTAGERAARDRKAIARAEQEDLQRRLSAAAADPGTLRVRSTPDNAGVWLLLGRAPFTSIALRTDQAWELRVELDGYQSKDVRVGARAWDGPESGRHAALDVALEPGALARPLPAIPDEPSAEDGRGVTGAGRLAVTTTPPGAAVWLLVGVTDTMALEGIEAGRDYDLKVSKDGFVPAFLRFAADDWRAGGDPALPLSAAPKKATLERNVELVPAPRTSGKVR